MKAFRFRLESLLKHREFLRDEAKRDYAEAQHAVDLCMADIQGLFNEIDASRERIARSEKEGHGQQVSLITSAHEFIRWANIKIERKRVEARELLAVAESKHEVLVEAARDFESLKKLKEKKKEEFRKDKKRKETKNIDEIVTMRFRQGIS